MLKGAKRLRVLLNSLSSPRDLKVFSSGTFLHFFWYIYSFYMNLYYDTNLVLFFFPMRITNTLLADY